jgi:hypothetical protein
MRAAESTNKSPASVTNQAGLTLIDALRTSAVGTHKITPAWTGLCAVVVATGIYTNPEPAMTATNRPIVRFDAVVITPKAAVGRVGPKGLARIDKDGGYTALHTLRDDLPSDTEIRAAALKDVGGMEKLLGPPHGFPATLTQAAPPRVKSQWSFATVRDGGIDTLQVDVISVKGSKIGSRIEALQLHRGSAHEEIKPPKKP